MHEMVKSLWVHSSLKSNLPWIPRVSSDTYTIRPIIMKNAANTNMNEIINLARHVLEVWRSVQAGSNSVACTVKGEALTVRTWRISLIAIYLQDKSYRWHSDAKTSFEYSSTAKSVSVERQLLIGALALTGRDARAAHESMTEALAPSRAEDVDQR